MNVHHLKQVKVTGQISGGTLVSKEIIECFPTSEEAWELAIRLAKFAQDRGYPNTRIGVMPTAQGWHAVYAIDAKRVSQGRKIK